MRTAAAVIGASLVYLVVRDGSPGWQLVRLILVVLLTFLTLVGIQRGGRGRRGGVAFTAGLLGDAVGVGIGVPHLAKTGLTLATVAGLMSLAGGLALVAGGGATWVGLTPRWRRAVVVPGLLIAGIVVWSLGQAIDVTNVPRTSVGSTTPTDSACGTKTSSSRPRTASPFQAGTCRPSTELPSSCSTVPVRTGRACTTIWSFSPGTDAESLDEGGCRGRPSVGLSQWSACRAWLDLPGLLADDPALTSSDSILRKWLVRERADSRRWPPFTESWPWIRRGRRAPVGSSAVRSCGWCCANGSPGRSNRCWWPRPRHR